MTDCLIAVTIRIQETPKYQISFRFSYFFFSHSKPYQDSRLPYQDNRLPYQDNRLPYQDSRLPYLPPTFFSIHYLLITLSFTARRISYSYLLLNRSQTHVHTCHCVHICIMVNDILIQLLGTEQCLCVTKDSGGGWGNDENNNHNNGVEWNAIEL